MPVLFFAACAIYLALKMADDCFVSLAWGFVALRLVHSVIHITYNNVNHRLLAYFLSVAVLASMWVRIGMAVY
jgi:hypothetical protein